ncbi:hypothetical protein EXS65_02325 [Candidatus Peribacteria bacterium]|nr:hypothetical protein [Candidatus Peribacteria bacterium]
MVSLRKASAAIFYLLGALTIVAIVLVNRGMFVSPLGVFLNIVDLPLLFAGMLFGGSTLVSSLSREKTSVPLALVVFTPLLIAFVFFAWINFAMPFAAV